MQRTLEIVVDAVSWAPKGVPPELKSLVGPRSVNVGIALIYTAIGTRPPTVRGFDLSDFWAYLRYAPAIADRPELRLREEWETVDPHQKTILSDELGVGFTTQFVTEALDCSEFTDALYVIKVLKPGKFTLKGGAKRGPKKSPDYIARDGKGRYVVLECKGTQSSIDALWDAIERGKAQKKNMGPVGSTRIRHSLVAGLFIPQWSASEGPLICISDPAREDMERLLHGQPPERVDQAITQISLAKQLALAGFVEVPNYLASSGVGGVSAVPEASRAEIERYGDSVANAFRLVFDTAGLRAETPGDTSARARLYVSTPASILEQLRAGVPTSQVISELREKSSQPKWHTHAGDFSAELVTPLGFGFRLRLN
jgi:hypothetical protein